MRSKGYLYQVSRLAVNYLGIRIIHYPIWGKLSRQGGLAPGGAWNAVSKANAFEGMSNAPPFVALLLFISAECWGMADLLSRQRIVRRNVVANDLGLVGAP